MMSYNSTRFNNPLRKCYQSQFGSRAKVFLGLLRSVQLDNSQEKKRLDVLKDSLALIQVEEHNGVW